MATTMATKFVEWEVPELDTLQDSKVYRLRYKLNNGGKMNREEKDWLTHNVNFNTYFTTAIPLMGRVFKIRNFFCTIFDPINVITH